MPKKFVGENSKAVAAKAKKVASKESELLKKQKEAEEEYWKDDDKHINKKKQRKEENERKRQQQLEKKAEMKALLDKELDSVKVVNKQPISKTTRAQILAETEKRNAATQHSKPTTAVKTHIEKPLEENLNRFQPDEVAHTVDEAIAMLNVSDTSEDKHPEKRIKAAYLAFEERNLSRIKSENPSLRLSQLKQLLFKEWAKSSENPLNTRD